MRTFREIFTFELRQQLRSPLFWIVATVLAALAFFMISSDNFQAGGGIGNTHRNAPYVVVSLLCAFSLIGMFLIPLFVASAALRDFETGTAELFFATPISRPAYLGGRFAAGYLSAIVMMVLIAAAMLIGLLMPWLDQARMGPTPWMAFAYALGVFVLPTMFFLSSVMFMLATLTRSMLTTYIGVILFFVLFMVANSAAGHFDSLTLAALIDPTGTNALDLATRYWSANDHNTRLPELGGALLANRAIFIVVGTLLIATSHALFRPDREGLRLWRSRAKLVEGNPPIAATKALPSITLQTSTSARWTQFVKLAWFDMRSVLGGAPFLVMLALGLMTHGFGMSSGRAEIYGTPMYPLTHLMIEELENSYNFLLAFIVLFYAGELVWRERSSRINEVTDAFPLPDWIPLLSKLVAIAAVIVLFMLAGTAECIGYQFIRGYYTIEPGLYLANIALTTLPLLLMGAMALFLQVIANNKFLGYLFAVVYVVSGIALDQLGYDHLLYNYGGAPATLYSDMNGYGHFLTGHLWFRTYWACLATALMVLASLFWSRGTLQGWRERLRTARERFHTPQRALLACSLLAFAGLGGWIFYNTNVINRYTTPATRIRQQAEYERHYRKYLDLPQPKITDVKVDVDIYPHDRKVDVRGHYVLVNKSGKPIADLHVLLPRENVKLLSLDFAPHAVVSTDPVNNYTIYHLDQPMAPGATMDFGFVLQYWSRGFRNSPGDISVVDNGTFFSNGMFPHFGYSEAGELTDRNDRRKYGLGPPHRVPKIDDVPAHQFNLLGRDADWVTFETTVSTVPDQIALAPGYLQKEWTANGRRYFHYRMDKPILDFFSFQSARYAVKKDTWNGVSLEVYYDPKHAWNVDRMLHAARTSMAYYSAAYSPYQFRQFRILEFPGYRSYAESFANTVPFSESAGFIADLRNKDDIDFVSNFTAHELAHQWWAHQVIGANVQGVTMLDETFAEYSALRMLEREYGPSHMRRYLNYELDYYLAGRGGELVDELPLALNEEQPYIHYYKGAMVMYSLNDLLGGNVVDRTLARFDHEWAFKGPPYPTTNDFLADLRQEAGPQGSSLITDLFEKITLFDNRVTGVTAKKRADGKYDVTLKIHAAKVYVDGIGKESKATIDTPIDIGVFAKAADGREENEKVLYLQKRNVADGDSTIMVTVDSEPYEAGIDPMNKLIDRVSEDNRKRVDLK